MTILICVVVGCVDTSATRGWTGRGSGDQGQLLLLQHEGRRASYEWRVSLAAMMEWPRWDVESGSLPLDASSAYRIGKAWIENRYGEYRLLEIHIVNAARGSSQLHGCLYYRMMFECGQFDSMYVVVGMDGKVVEPVEVLGVSKEK